MSKKKEPFSAFSAIEKANRLSCAPFEFQAAACLLDLGVLNYLDKNSKGADIKELCEHLKLSSYAVRVLVDSGLAFNLLEEDAEGKLHASKIAYFLLHDKMTRANFEFAQNVCYQGLAYLKESLKKGSPKGLNTLGNAQTIYPIISKLLEPAKSSWFRFDHFYSDTAYNESLPFVFETSPKTINDIGGNTGKFAQKCCEFDDSVHVTIYDLPEQCDVAKKSIEEHGLSKRIGTEPVDILSSLPLPDNNADVWWMSQFLDCFSESQVVSILQKISKVMRRDARIFILEPLIGEQPFDIGNSCLAAFSLYFTAIANGYSRFYHLTDFQRMIEKAGLCLEAVHNRIGTGHSLLICKAR